jgi:3-phenylpropionate/trans-cinnamate dioxygenase ferredoxin subunit
MRFHRVIAAAELAEGKGVAVEVEGRDIFLVRCGEKVHALDNLCPHFGAPLKSGRVVNGVIACPLHGARFDLATGECKTRQLGVLPAVVTHTVQVVDGHVEVALSDAPVSAPVT